MLSLFVHNDVGNLRNQQFEAYDTCYNAQQLNQTLNGYDFNRYFGDLNKAQQEISEITRISRPI